MVDPRRPLGAGILTLIVVDAVLVLTFLALLLQAVRADVVDIPGVGVTEAATLAESPSPSVDAVPSSSTGDVTFALPSGNIMCTLADGAATCVIVQFSYPAPELQGCAGSVGHEVRLTGAGADWVCREGGAPEPAGAGVAVLDYGATTSAHGFTCESSRTGVFCRHDDSGHSFSLARGGATLD